ncbi:unnamed protein product [Dracunculus medinensis]|uniref:SAC3_GANP domain-containing protein n=1 Tax=Dracunculus medinensis TaxID=318479 RepID=A0A0N4U2I3_DRAME|nr:unnamed protein product [Dracunculus medinensis]
MSNKAYCLSMCPQSEVIFRRKNGLVHFWNENDEESLENAKKPDDSHFMVKEYTRSAAGKEILNFQVLRPFSVLEKTVFHLMKIANNLKSNDNWSLAYGFITDRLRAVRQDMTVQRLNPMESLQLLESIIIFYIKAFYRCEIGIDRCATYDRKLHRMQLYDCLADWRELFEHLKLENERILQCYLFVNALEPWSLLQLKRWKSFLSIDSLKFAEEAIISMRTKNFVRFFRLISKQNDLILRCSMLFHASFMRFSALLACSIAYKCRNVKLPFHYLLRVLKMDKDALCQALNEIGFEGNDFYSFGVEVNSNIGLSSAHWLKTQEIAEYF